MRRWLRRRRVPREVEEAIKLAAETATELLAFMPEMAAVYAELDPLRRPPQGDERARAWHWVETIARAWRGAERADATLIAVEDDLVTEESNALLGAIEDSLVVSLSEDPDTRARALSVAEVAERVEALRAEGVFGAQIPRRPVSDEGPSSEADAEQFAALSEAVRLAAEDSATAYGELAPDGRELEPDVAAGLRDRIELNAIACRAYDAGRDLHPAVRARRDRRMTLAILRTMQHGFVLSLSSDPERRARVASAEEVEFRLKPVREAWGQD